MKSLILLATGLLILTTAESVAAAKDLAEAIEKVQAEVHGYNASDPYRKLFTAAGPEGLAQLKRHKDDSIAIQAAWEEVRLTVPEADGPGAYRIDREKLDWFVGFLEARSHSTPPEWWVESVRGAKAYRRDNIRGGKPKKSLYHSSNLISMSAPIGTIVMKFGKKYIIHRDHDSIVIPTEIVDSYENESVSVAFTENECFATTHGGAGYPHKVVCIDRKTGRLRWEAEACGCFWGVINGIIIGTDTVSVVVNEDRVTLFGLSSLGFYAQSFSRENGKTLFRFSTGF